MIPTFETVLERIKDGPFQYLLFLCCSSWGFFGGMQVILSAFMVPPQVTYECRPRDLQYNGWTPEEQRNFSLPMVDGNYSQCLQYKRNYFLYSNVTYTSAVHLASLQDPSPSVEHCSHWEYDYSIFTKTLISDYDLVCEKLYLRSFVQGAFMLGVMVGSPVGGLWGDWRGRLSVIRVSFVGFLTVGLLIYFTENFILFLLARFTLGFFGHCLYQTSYILVVEWSLPKRRSSFGISFSVPFAVGYMVLPGIAFFIRDYHMLLLTLGCLSLSLIASFLIMTESPRWSIQHGKVNQAMQAIDKACRINSQDLLDKEWLLQTFARIRKMPDKTDMNEYQSDRKSNLRRGRHPILASPQLRRYTFILTFCWIITTMVYYGLALNTGSFNFNPFLYIFLSGVMELPAYTVTVPVVTRFGRRRPAIVAYVLCGVFLLVALCLPEGVITYWAALVLNMAGKLSVTCAFQILLLYTSEIFPTCVRTQGVGVTMMIGRLGAISSPFIIDILGAKFWALPNIIFGGASIVAGILTILLPETSKQNLPDTAEDVENWLNNTTDDFSSIKHAVRGESIALKEENNIEDFENIDSTSRGEWDQKKCVL